MESGDGGDYVIRIEELGYVSAKGGRRPLTKAVGDRTHHLLQLVDVRL